MSEDTSASRNAVCRVFIGSCLARIESRSIAGSRPTPSSPRSSRSPSSSWLSRCRPAGPVEGAAAATRPVCNADLPPMTQRCGTRCKEKLAKHASATSEAASETRQKHREREENAQFIEERSRDARSLRRDKCLCPYNAGALVPAATDRRLDRSTRRKAQRENADGLCDKHRTDSEFRIELERRQLGQ